MVSELHQIFSKLQLSDLAVMEQSHIKLLTQLILQRNLLVLLKTLLQEELTQPIL
jgi:hypothetical protein